MTKFLSRFLSYMDISFIVLLIVLLYIPASIEINAIKILDVVLTRMYSFSSTIMVLILLIGNIVLFSYAFFNTNIKVNWDLQYNKKKVFISKMFGYTKAVAIFYLASELKYNYIAILSIIILIEKLAMEPLMPAVKTKMTLLALAGDKSE